MPLRARMHARTQAHAIHKHTRHGADARSGARRRQLACRVCHAPAACSSSQPSLSGPHMQRPRRIAGAPRQATRAPASRRARVRVAECLREEGAAPGAAPVQGPRLHANRTGRARRPVRRHSVGAGARRKGGARPLGGARAVCAARRCQWRARASSGNEGQHRTQGAALEQELGLQTRAEHARRKKVFRPHRPRRHSAARPRESNGRSRCCKPRGLMPAPLRPQDSAVATRPLFHFPIFYSNPKLLELTAAYARSLGRIRGQVRKAATEHQGLTA